MTGDKKNIVLIIVDAFRTKNISLFGYEKETDKNIKRLAEESLVFKDFFSSSNSTAPSVMSIFTGRFPQHHGILHQFPYTTEEEIAKMKREKTFWLSSYLQSKGYETIGIDWIGMWFKEGFDYYKEKEEKPSKKKDFFNIPVIKKALLNLPNWAYKFGKKVTKARASTQFCPAKETMDLAIEKLKEAKKPFFLFAHFWDTHFPFPTTKFKESEKNDISDVLSKIKDKSQKEYFKKRVTDINLNSTEDMIDKYDASITEVDKQIGKLHSFLKKNKLWEDTIFIVLGDHGTSLTEHGVYFSGSSLFDETIHVPFILHLPGIESKEINGFVQNVDIAPTILDYLNFNAEKSFDGISMLKLIKEGKQIRDKVFFVDGLALDIKGVRTANRKFIMAKHNTCNLCKAQHHKSFEEYDLKKDPQEEKNIYSETSESKVFLEPALDSLEDTKKEVQTSESWI